MRRLGSRSVAFVALLVLPLAACLQIDTGQDGGGGGGGGGTPGASSASTGADGGAGATPSAPTGTSGCGTDPQSGAVLCLSVDACPGLELASGAYPGCGFAPRGPGVIDMECLCGDSLCPVGVATTCGAAKTLIDNQSSLVVCEQLAEGRCVQQKRSTVTVDAGSTGGCNEACAETCANVPTCLQMCGC
jgi:hypothetical protein